jgi:SprT-like protein
MLTRYQLKKYAEKFLDDNYGLELVVPLELNGRLKRACGRFVSYANPRKPKVVEMSKSFIENNEPKLVLDVLRHELVHYALFMQNKPNSDGHPVFENELKRLGIVSQKTIDKYEIASELQIYQCKECNHEFKLTKRLKNNGINHKCKCGGKLLDRGKRLIVS